MVDYFEFHISKSVLERIISISLIIILFIVYLFALKYGVQECPTLNCNNSLSPNNEQKEEVLITSETTQEVLPVPVVVETPNNGPGVYYVDIQNFNMAPSKLTVKMGSTMVFRNKEKALVHKLYEVKGLFFSPRIEPYGEFRYTLNQTGNFTIMSIMGKDRGTKMDLEVIE